MTNAVSPSGDRAPQMSIRGQVAVLLLLIAAVVALRRWIGRRRTRVDSAARR
ncbi:hypothetical protein [Micromonospora sp. KC606]|uniref:hypothetical protein n=1 Tax=Micromonospora sp. KC606 TaxID=2530379 RepID=UPI001404F6A3|nr:hypothetical protein [Micromonospora sp. KC606]